MRFFILASCVAIAVSTNVGCDPPTQKRASKTANAVLSAINSEDISKVKSLLSQDNLEDLKDMSDEDFIDLMKETQHKFGHAKKIEDMRFGRVEGEVLAKVRAIDEDVVVMLLIKEKGQYRFQDVRFYSRSEYEELKKI